MCSGAARNLVNEYRHHDDVVNGEKEVAVKKKIPDEMINQSRLNTPQKEDVETITFPVGPGESEQIVIALKESGAKHFRPWWYQATAYIVAGLKADGFKLEGET